jgi:hypothetical protein
MDWKNKYSKKIEKYIDKMDVLKKDFITIPSDHTIIKKIKDIYKKLIISPLTTQHSSIIKEKSNLKYPLSYNLKNDKDIYDKWILDIIKGNTIPKVSKKKISEYYISSNQKDKLALEKLTDIIYNSIYISIDIQFAIEKMKIHYVNYSNEYLNLHIYSDDKKNINIELINKIVLLIKTISGNSYPVELFLILTNQKKYIIDKIKKISAFNANSGYSISESKIVIWRYEEIYKVLIHELCHYYKIDSNIRSSYNEKKILRKFHSIFNVKKNIDSVTETYTEIFAVFIHTLLLSIINNENFNKLINDEIKFSFFQVSKILKLFNATSLKELVDKKIFIDIGTSVISYYIVKLGILLNLNQILDFWEQNSFIVKEESPEYIEIYYKSIDNLINIYNDIFIGIIKYLKNDKCNCFVNRTFRMTMYQIK